MKALGIEGMMTWFKSKGVHVVGTSEEFYGTRSGANIGIWISAESTPALFDYYKETWYNSHGVKPTLNEQTEKRGWYFEWHDAGTMMVWEN